MQLLRSVVANLCTTHVFLLQDKGEMVMRAYTPTSSDDDLGYFELVVKIYKANEHPKFPLVSHMPPSTSCWDMHVSPAPLFEELLSLYCTSASQGAATLCALGCGCPKLVCTASDADGFLIHEHAEVCCQLQANDYASHMVGNQHGSCICGH